MKSSFGMAPQMSHYSCYNATVCGRYCWSQWFDRDNPSGTGDWETLADIAQQYPWTCARRPVLAECQATDGTPFYQTGNRVIFNSVDGCICRNIDNFPRRCRDYRIRVLCPCWFISLHAYKNNFPISKSIINLDIYLNTNIIKIYKLFYFSSNDALCDQLNVFLSDLVA